MFELLTVVFIYTLVFGADYLWYREQPETYQYVSRRTYTLFLIGVFPVIYLFYDQLEAFYAHIWTEVWLTALLLCVMLLFSYALTREKLLVCHTSSRSERCLTPGYVLVKGKELLFQQVCYAGIALALYGLMGATLWSYIAYVLILIIMHTTIILSLNHDAAFRLTAGIAVIAAPLFYTFTEINHFWPALYLHTIVYIPLWLVLANWEGKGNLVSRKT